MSNQTSYDGEEQGRPASLGAHQTKGIPAYPAIDKILGLLADIVGAPIAFIALTDGSVIGSSTPYGPDIEAKTHTEAFGALTRSDANGLIVPDTAVDARFVENPLVTGQPGIRFCMALPLKERDGHTLGTLWVMDTVPRSPKAPIDAGRLEVFASMIVDELQRRDADRHLSENRRLLDLAETMSGVGHWRFDVRTGEVVWSDEVYRIHGLDPAQFDPMLDDVLSFYHPDDRPVLEGHIAHALTTGEGYEFRLRVQRTDGHLRDVAAKATCETDGAGRVIGLFGVFQDITDQVAALAEVQRSRAHYQALTETVSDVIARVPLDGSAPYVSPRITDLLGYEPEEVTGRPPYDLIAESDRGAMVAVYQAMARGQEDATVRHRALHRDGRTIWAETRLRLVRDDDGQPNCVVAVIRDISAQKALEDELTLAREAAEAAASVKSEFLANMSHELRTPLTSIIGFATLTSSQPDLSTVAREYVGRVEHASRALLCTVNDILDFSKLEAGQVAIRAEPSDVVRLCQATLDLFTPQAGSKDVSLRLAIDPSAEGHFLVDPDRVRQILLNLVGNGVKFTQRGEVSLSVSHMARTGSLSISITDTGDGIPADKVPLLFKRFSQVDGSMTRHHGGTGLGLAICKGLVDAMGGEIGVSPAPSGGSRFWFTIPTTRVAQTDVETATPPVRDTTSLDGVRILVADDHPSNRELARLFLYGLGAVITEAEDGHTACTTAARWPFDVILMDVRMPGLDGIEALHQIRKGSGPNDATPILAFTADADQEESERLMKIGFDGVVSKPIEAASLITAIALATDFARDLPDPVHDGH